MLRLVVPWLIILVLAVANGALRELVLLPRFGYPWALLLSGFLLCACVVLVAWLSHKRMRIATARHALAAGVLWLSLTLVFEFSLGRLVQGKAWTELFAAYTFERGNLWLLVLLTLLLSPAAVWHVKSSLPTSGTR